MLKQIDGYENYFVDNEGNVYRKLKPSWNKQTKRTYKQVVLSEPGKTKSQMIHRLVAKAFVENPENYNLVHHKDGNKFNNSADNLEWMDETYHRKLHVAMGECRVNNFINCELYKDEQLIGSFKSIAEAARYANNNYGVSYYQLAKNKENKGFKIVKKGVTTN